MTLITTLRQDGVAAFLVLDDPNSAIPRYVKEVHVPAISPGDIVSLRQSTPLWHCHICQEWAIFERI
jgi:hypothetical protein